METLHDSRILVLASTEVLGALSHSQSVSLFFALFSLSGLGLATANYWALTQTIVPKGAMGRAVGVQNFASNCSGIVAADCDGLAEGGDREAI